MNKFYQYQKKDHTKDDITTWYDIENNQVVETLKGSNFLHQYIGLSSELTIAEKIGYNILVNYQGYRRSSENTTKRKGYIWYVDAEIKYHIIPHISLMSSYFIRYDRLPLLQGVEYTQEEVLRVGALANLCNNKLSLSMSVRIPTQAISKREYKDITVADFHFISAQDAKIYNNTCISLSLKYNFGKGSASKSHNQNRSEKEK